MTLSVRAEQDEALNSLTSSLTNVFQGLQMSGETGNMVTEKINILNSVIVGAGNHSGVDQVANAASLVGEAGSLISEGTSISAGAAATAAAAATATAVSSSSESSGISSSLFDLLFPIDNSFISSFQVQMDGIVGMLPVFLQSGIHTISADFEDLIFFHPTLYGIARLGIIYYFLFTTPSPLVGILDFYIFGPLVRATRKQFNEEDFTLRNRLGNGNYGQVYEGLRNRKRGDPDLISNELTSEQKNRRVVLKKTNIDREGVRANFLRSGTIARGAAETGQVEDYVCTRISAHPTIRSIAAEYLGNFMAGSTAGGITVGTQWLVWRFESDATLGDACSGALGPFPECLAPIMLGNRKSEALGAKDPEKRDSEAIKTVIYRLLKGLKKLHSLGIVHR